MINDLAYGSPGMDPVRNFIQFDPSFADAWAKKLHYPLRKLHEKCRRDWARCRVYGMQCLQI
jgi:hypothetical protein